MNDVVCYLPFGMLFFLGVFVFQVFGLLFRTPVDIVHIYRRLVPKISWTGYAPINVKPLRGGGRPGIGGGFDVTSLPVVGTFDHSLSSGGRDF